MLKKPNALCYGGLQLLIPSSSSFPPPASLWGQRRPWCFPSCRFYATAHDIYDKDLSWPTSPCFTPYDVFKQDRGAPYSKSRFYDLVKIYHPDRPCNDHPLCRHLTPEVRLQRYHLVVAAHEILSDPAKRAAYDQFGTGWSLHPREVLKHSPLGPEQHRVIITLYTPMRHGRTGRDGITAISRNSKRSSTIGPL